MGGCAGKTNTTPKTTGSASPPLPEEKPATKAPAKGTKAELEIQALLKDLDDFVKENRFEVITSATDLNCEAQVPQPASHADAGIGPIEKAGYEGDAGVKSDIENKVHSAEGEKGGRNTLEAHPHVHQAEVQNQNVILDEVQPQPDNKV